VASPGPKTEPETAPFLKPRGVSGTGRPTGKQLDFHASWRLLARCDCCGPLDCRGRPRCRGEVPSRVTGGYRETSHVVSVSSGGWDQVQISCFWAGFWACVQDAEGCRGWRGAALYWMPPAAASIAIFTLAGVAGSGAETSRLRSLRRSDQRNLFLWRDFGRPCGVRRRLAGGGARRCPRHRGSRF
jgi:hypothetical protein